MQKSLEFIQQLDDIETIKMVKQIYQDIFKSFSFQTVKTQTQNDSSLSMLHQLEKETLQTHLDSEHSISLCRKMLQFVAQDEKLSSLIPHAWEKIKRDDSLMIETIVSLGLIVNFTLFIATTEVELDIKGVKIKKSTASSEQIQAVLTPLAELIKKITF